jgi:uncharacterized membrane protein (DUF4010 family)
MTDTSLVGRCLGGFVGALAMPSLNDQEPVTEAPKLNLEQPFLTSGSTELRSHLSRFACRWNACPEKSRDLGFNAVSIAGGLLSTASAVAAAGTGAAHNEVPVQIAADGAVLGSLTSTLIDIPLIARVAAQRSFTVRLSFALDIIAAVGIAGVLLHDLLKL